MPDATRWALIVHGGAKRIDVPLRDRNRQGCLRAVAAGAAILRSGGSAVLAAEAAVRVLEDDPVFNAGYGSVLNGDGEVEMDAAIMDGGLLAVGAVTGVRRIANPIQAAAALLPELPVLLAGAGAERFAANAGIVLCDPDEMIAREALASENAGEHDTVGCVALDATGSIAAATSTGGLPGKHVGRIGDSPIAGAGLYADDQLGGVALSGDGESILRTMLAAHAMHVLGRHGANAAANHALRRLDRVGGEAGAIVLDRNGRFGVAHNSDHFAVALAASWLDAPRAGLHRNDLEEVLDG